MAPVFEISDVANTIMMLFSSFVMFFSVVFYTTIFIYSSERTRINLEQENKHLSAEAQEDDRLGQKAHTDGAGEAYDRGNLKADAGFPGYIFHILPRQAGGDGRYQVRGHGHGQSGGNINQWENNTGQETVTGL